MKNVSFVYFDIDDTLLDHGLAERAALTDLIREFPNDFGRHDEEHIHAVYHEVNSKVWAEYADGSRSKEGAKYGRFELLLERLPGSRPEAATHFGDAYLDRYERHWTFISGALEAFTATAAHTPVGLLTNGFSEVQRKKLARFPDLERHARQIVISEEVGVLKPDPALFAHAARLADTPPENILYVGDSKRSDVDGGLGAGWRVAWFGGSDHPSEMVWSFRKWTEFTDRW